LGGSTLKTAVYLKGLILYGTLEVINILTGGILFVNLLVYVTEINLIHLKEEANHQLKSALIVSGGIQLTLLLRKDLIGLMMNVIKLQATIRKN
tara:strand:+ start:216 stop:497 length:282 start_codon:yes stop_codon:yes gene_type:complete